MKLKDFYRDLIPNNKAENYRLFNIEEVLNKEFIINNCFEINKEFMDKYIDNNFYYIIFENGNFNLTKSHIIDSILIEESPSGRNKEDFFHDVNEDLSLFQNMISVISTLDKPLMILNFFNGKNSFTPILYEVYIGDDISIDILDLSIVENKKSDSLFSFNQNINIGPSSKVNYISIDKSDDIIIKNINTNIGEKSALNYVILDKYIKEKLTIFNNIFEEENALLNLSALIKNKGLKLNNIINVFHNQNNCISKVNYKHILNNKSKSILSVTSNIKKATIGSKTLQSSKGILLDEDSLLLVSPKLKIYNDELEASHSSTIGVLNEDEINYLMNRGINKALAHEILLSSFEKEIVEKIESKEIINYLKNF